MFEILLQSETGVSMDLFKWIVGGMAAGIIAVAVFLKWLITKMLAKTEDWFNQIMKRADIMHEEAMVVLKESNERGIAELAYRKAAEKETRSDLKEIKDDIKKINEKLGIKNES